MKSKLSNYINAVAFCDTSGGKSIWASSVSTSCVCSSSLALWILLAIGAACGVLSAQTSPIHVHVKIPASNSIQTDLISTFPTGIFRTQNGLATPFHIPSLPDTCGYTGTGACNFYDAFGFNGDGQSITINVRIPNVHHVYALMNAYTPAPGERLATIKFVGSNGATDTFPLVAGTNIRDFYQGGYANTLDNGIPNVVALNAFLCVDPTNCLGAGGTGNVNTGLQGTYVVDEQEFFLSSEFSTQDLIRIMITDTYNGSDPILLGITADIGSISGPNATLSVDHLGFASQLVDTGSAAQPVTLINNGSESLDITSILASVDFRKADNCGSSLPPGGYCTIKVTFEPKHRGHRTGTLTITDNASDSPQKVSLTGIGTVVKLNPPSVDFGTVTVGQKSSPQNTTLTNVGKTSLHITDITITGTDSGDFFQQNNCPAPGYLDAGKSCSVAVTFQPTQVGARSANVSVSDDGGGSPQQVSLSGIGQEDCSGPCSVVCRFVHHCGCRNDLCVPASVAAVGETVGRLRCSQTNPFTELK